MCPPGSVFILTHCLLPSRPLVILHVAHSQGMFQCVSDIKEGLDSSSSDSLCRPDKQTDKQTHCLSEDRGSVLSCLKFEEDAAYRSVNTFYSISSLEIALRGRVSIDINKTVVGNGFRGFYHFYIS